MPANSGVIRGLPTGHVRSIQWLPKSPLAARPSPQRTQATCVTRVDSKVEQESGGLEGGNSQGSVTSEQGGPGKGHRDDPEEDGGRGR